MNDDALNDLKQFIAATVTQQTTDLRSAIRTDIQSDLHTEIQSLRTELVTKIDDLSASVAQALETSNDTIDEQLQNHELRLTKLESLTAA